MGRGMCRSTIITYLNAPGAHTSSLPLADAVTASSATYSLSTVNGASLVPVAFQCSIVVLVRTWPGPDHQDPNPVLTQRFSEAEVEAVEPGLGGAVDEVGPPHPLTGRGAHRDDLAEALCAHLLAEQHPDRNRCGVVDLGDLHGFALVLPQLLGVAEQAERHDRDIYITPGEGGVDHLGMACGVDPVEVDQLDGPGARRLHLRDGVVAARVSGQFGQHDARRCVAQISLADGQPDLGRASEQQNGLRIAYGV